MPPLVPWTTTPHRCAAELPPPRGALAAGAALAAVRGAGTAARGLPAEGGDFTGKMVILQGKMVILHGKMVILHGKMVILQGTMGI